MNPTPSYRTTSRFWLVFILTILVLCSISACGGGDPEPESESERASIPVAPSASSAR